MYSKDLVTFNMLSMNLSLCRSKASTQSAGKPMSAALFCNSVLVDCSFRAYHSFRNDQGVDTYTYKIACSGIFYVSIWQTCVVLGVCVCLSKGGEKKEKGGNDNVRVCRCAS